MSAKSHLLLSKSAFQFSGSKSSFRIDDLLKNHSSQQCSEKHDTLNVHHREHSTPSPSQSPRSSISPPHHGIPHHTFNIDPLSLVAAQHHRQQQQLLQSCTYPYNPLLKFGLSFMPPNNLFARDFLNPYHPYSPPTLDHLPFLLRDRFLHFENSGSRKCRRSRTVFSELQLMALEKRFERQKYLSTPDRMELADALGLTQLQVKTWYQNRRMKWKKQVQQTDSSNDSEQEKVNNDGILESTEFDLYREKHRSSSNEHFMNTQDMGSGGSSTKNDQIRPARMQTCYEPQTLSPCSSNKTGNDMDNVSGSMSMPTSSFCS